jgi:hypothetical protein
LRGCGRKMKMGEDYLYNANKKARVVKVRSLSTHKAPTK